MRLMPASLAASLNRANDRVTPGRLSDLVVNRTRSVAKNSARTAAAAPLNELWPLVYDGNGGVSSSGVQSGSATRAGVFNLSASRIAVTGRQTSKRNLQSQQAMATSAIATLSMANSRAVSARFNPRSRAIVA